MSDTVFRGKLRQWNKDKGFGLIGRKKGKQEALIHRSEFKDLTRQPKVGDSVSYQAIEAKGGKIQAVNAHINGVSTPHHVTTIKVQKQKTKNGTQKLVTFLAIFLGIVAVVNLIKYIL